MVFIQMKDELQLAKLNYEALNQQLLDDIPKFCSMSEEYLQKCLSALIHSVSAYFTKMELAFKKIAKPLVSFNLISLVLFGPWMRNYICSVLVGLLHRFVTIYYGKTLYG